MSWSLFKDNVAVVTKCLFFTICAFFFGKNAFQAWLVHESGLTTTTTTIEPVPAVGKVINPKYYKNSNESFLKVFNIVHLACTYLFISGQIWPSGQYFHGQNQLQN